MKTTFIATLFAAAFLLPGLALAQIPLVILQSLCHTFNVNLVPGDEVSYTKRAEISALQNVLLKNGFSIKAAEQGVRYGKSTASAVYSFQAKYGIKRTSTVGPLTRMKLNSLYGCKKPLIPSSSASSTPSSATPTSNPPSSLPPLSPDDLKAGRIKGLDAAIKAYLSNVRASAEIYYDSHNNYGIASSGSCSTGLFADSEIAKDLAGVVTAGGSPQCYASGKTGSQDMWAIASPLNTSGTHWCVDGRGNVGDVSVAFDSNGNPYCNTSNPNLPHAASVIFPNGGENLTEGQTYTLTWNLGSFTGSQVSLMLADDGNDTLATTIISNLPAGTTSYSWRANAADIPGGNHHYRLAVLPDGNLNNQVQSANYFTISGGTKIPIAATVITNPMGGSYKTGDPILISWNSSTSDSHVYEVDQVNIPTGNSLILSSNTVGTSFAWHAAPINGQVYDAASGTYKMLSGPYKIAISCPDGTCSSAESSSFTIASPISETVPASPSGGVYDNTIAVSCSVSSYPNAPVGKVVTWKVDGAAGGSGGYTYSWTGTDGLSGTGSSVSMSYSSPGSKSAVATVQSGNSLSSCTLRTTIVSSLAAPVLSSVFPTSGIPGSGMRLNGSNFDLSDNDVIFTNLASGTSFTQHIGYSTELGTAIQMSVPQTLSPGQYSISLKTGGQTSGAVNFEVKDPASIPQYPVVSRFEQSALQGVTFLFYTLNNSSPTNTTSCTLTGPQLSETVATGAFGQIDSYKIVNTSGTYVLACGANSSKTLVVQ